MKTQTDITIDLFADLAARFNPKNNPTIAKLENKLLKEFAAKFNPTQSDSEDCPECEGEGHFDTISDCCGADREPDLGLCYECHDHCEPVECDNCQGTGKIQAK